MSSPTPDHARLITAIVDTLVPADDSGPGGSEAGVDTYIAGVVRDNEAMRGMYEPSLDALDAYATASAGANFADLDLEGRTKVLKALEAGEAEGGFVPDAATFFAILHHNMLEGLFGDPQYGGNVDFAGWKLVGYRGVKLVQAAADQAIDGAPERPLTGRREALDSALAELGQDEAVAARG
jgi:gluconate 2-dehydrogenase gamma chain